MQRNTIRIVLLIMTAVWILTIFVFSAKPASESMKQSDGIVEQIIRIFVPDYEQLSAEQQQNLSDTLSRVVRKGAHMAEYAVLAVILYALLSKWSILPRRILRAIVAWGGATLYAVTDEFHQIFVPGRSGAWTDVLIDSTGGLIGVTIAVVIAYILQVRKDKKEMS